MGNWDNVSNWYDNLVSEKGHYYHENVIIPKVLKILEKKASVLDLACGQGILERYLTGETEYLGIDISSSLIQKANQYKKIKNHKFLEKDICQKFDLQKKEYEAATLMLAIQDLDDPVIALKNAYNHLKKDGVFIIVLNHPAFRIPRQTSWQIDEKQKMLYRRVNVYMSELKIPISISPSKKERSKEVFSHHFPLSVLSNYLSESGFLIRNIYEWVSDKKSTGGKSRMENKAREEIPMFLTIVAIK
ncbi:MAG: class I SAM-dependent methyltransferase [Parachlamydiales bacterium]|jgi:SAM-dependent methyltransferase